MRGRYQYLVLVLVLAFVGVASGQDYIVYTWYNGSVAQVYRANSNFAQVIQLTHSAYSASDPVISPDGLNVVYTQEEGTDHRANLWIMNADGSGARQLTFNSVAAAKRAFMPCWHPNGQKVYYTQETTGPYAVIREVSIDGSGDNLVVSSSSGACYAPAVNPANSTQLAYIIQSTYSQNGTIRLRSLANGAESTLLAPNGAADYHMVFSPDGQYLLWSEQTDGSSQNFALRRMNLSTLATVTLVPAAGDLNIYGAYSVDGQYIYYSTTHGASFSTTQFYRMPAGGGAGTLLYTQPGTGRGYLGNVGSVTSPTSGGLIAHWPFDGNASDVSGSGYNGTASNTYYDSDRFGNSNGGIHLNGTSSTIAVPNSSAANVDFLSISAWVKLDRVTAGAQVIAAKWYCGNYCFAHSYVLEILGGTRRPQLTLLLPGYPQTYGKRVTTANVDIPLGSWTLITATYDGSYCRIYINGQLDIANPAVGNIVDGTSPLVIGSHAASVDFNGFSGTIDDLRIYDYALSLQEVNDLYGSGTAQGALVANWTFTGNANDISGYGNNGIVSGATLTTGHDGASNSAYSLSNGTHIRVPNSASLNPTSQFTISAWVNYRGGSPNPRIFSKARDNFGYEFGILESWYNGVRKLFVHLGGQRLESNGVVPVGSWHHVAVTKDNTAINFYIDGALDVSRPYSGTIANTTEDGYIGRQMYNSFCDCLNGDLDEVRIYNRALSAQEVTGLYGGGAVQPPTVELVSPNGNEHWQVGGDHTITWELSGGPVSEIELEVSYDGGITWIVLADVSSSTQIEQLSVPFDSKESIECKVRITVIGPGGASTDMTNGEFALTNIASQYPVTLYGGVVNLSIPSSTETIPCNIRVFSEDYSLSSDNILETVVQATLPGPDYRQPGPILDLRTTKINLSLVDDEASLFNVPAQTIFYQDDGWQTAPVEGGFFESLSLWTSWVVKTLLKNVEKFGTAIKLALAACDYILAAPTGGTLNEDQKWLIWARENSLDDFEIPDLRPYRPSHSILGKRYFLDFRLANPQTLFEIVLQDIKCANLSDDFVASSSIENPNVVSIDIGKSFFGVSSTLPNIGPTTVPPYPVPGELMNYFSEVVSIKATAAGDPLTGITKQVAIDVVGPSEVTDGSPLGLEVSMELLDPDDKGFWSIEQAEAWVVLKDNNGSIYSSPSGSLYRWDDISRRGQWYSATEPPEWWSTAASYSSITFGLLLGFIPVIGVPLSTAYGAGMVFTQSSFTGDLSTDQLQAIYGAQSMYDFYEIKDKITPIGSAEAGRRTKTKWYIPVLLDDVDDDIQICIGPFAIVNREYHKGYLSPRPTIVINPDLRTQHPDAMEFTAYCPVTLSVESFGQVSGPSTCEIPNSSYHQGDFNGDGDIDSRIVLTEANKSIYKLTVSRKPDYPDSSTFSLVQSSGEGRTVIVNHMRVDEIDPRGYLFSTLDSGSISGVITSNSTPRSGVVVNLSGLNGDFLQSTTTGLDGRYQFLDLANGSYVVSILPSLGFQAEPEETPVNVHGLPSNRDFVLIKISEVVRSIMLPNLWFAGWSASPAGTIRSYIGNIPAGHTASNIVPSSIRLNGQVPIYGNTSRVRPSMTGFTGSVLEIAFGRQLAVQSLGANPPTGTHTVLITGDFTDGNKFIAAVDIMLSGGIAKESDEESEYFGEPLPTDYRLGDAHPNPFNPSTTINFDLPVTGQVKLEIYNIMGQTVRTVIDGVLPAGTHSYEWNSTDDAGNRVASGVYLYRIHAGDFAETKKMVLLK